MDLSKKYLFRKVPEITLLFWVVKLVTTALGEATSDYLVLRYNPYLAVITTGVLLLLALIWQFKAKKYYPITYWVTAAMVAIFGTMAADGLHIQLGVPYIVSSAFFAICLIVIFIWWQKVEHTLSIHTINTRRRELFYWATVIATFALGTALGDLTATTFGLGYFVSGILFFVLFLTPFVLKGLFKINEILAFWTAYVLTRPLGASFADWFSKPKAIGGLDHGDGHTAILLGLIFFVLVLFMTFNARERKLEKAT